MVATRKIQRTVEPTLLNEVLPEYEYHGIESVRIHASPAQIFRALREVTLAEMPLAYVLATIRYLPGLLTGRLKRGPDERSRPFIEVANSPVLREEPDREVVTGSIGKLHNLLDQQFVQPLDAERFAAFGLTEYEKLAMSFRIADGDDVIGYTLVAEHRTHALGPSARRKFALYWWLMIRWGGNLVLRMMLEAVKRRAERVQRVVTSDN